MEQEQEQQAPTQEQELPVADVQQVAQEAAPEEEEVAPTKSVKNFWERLDDVFTQNIELRKRMEELVEQFPDRVEGQNSYHSFIFQPERLALCSNDDIQQNTSLNLSAPLLPLSPSEGHVPSEKFYSFRIRLKRPLRNIKSIQLLSCVIPNATQNIPDDQVFFFWYKIRSVALANRGAWSALTTYTAGDIVSYLGQTWACGVGVTGTVPQIYWTSTQITPTPSIQQWNAAVTYLTGALVQYNGRVYQSQSASNEGKIPDVVYWVQTTLPADTTRPNYYDINPEQIKYLWLSPSYYWPAEWTAAGTQLQYNRTFEDYNDLVSSLNYIMLQFQQFNNAQNDISFEYDNFLNKIVMVPNPANQAAGYYYLPCGYDDPNIAKFMSNPETRLFDGRSAFRAVALQFTPGYTLNLRLGFTWNGNYPNPFLNSNPWTDLNLQSILWWYLRKRDPGFYPYVAPVPPNPPNPYLPDWSQQTITFNSYPDLVNTSCVRVYADFALGSTQDSIGSSAGNTPVIDGLLSIVPINTTNLGVGFYQNTFNNPLTKIPQNLTEIGISMYTDQGSPYYLPNSATVLLELGITYH